MSEYPPMCSSHARTVLRLALAFVLVAAFGTTGATAAAAHGNWPQPQPTADEWYTWGPLALKPGVVTPSGGSHVEWPQTLVGKGQIAPPCGVWYQQDLYRGTRSAIDAVVGDARLTSTGAGYEDRNILLGNNWKFVYGGNCPTPTPTPPPTPTPTPPWEPEIEVSPVVVIAPVVAPAAVAVAVQPTFTG